MGDHVAESAGGPEPSGDRRSPWPWSGPHPDEPAGPVPIGRLLASSSECDVRLGRLLAHPTGLVVELEYRFATTKAASRRVGNPQALYRTPGAGPQVGIRYPDGTHVTSSSPDPAVEPGTRLESKHPPAITPLEAQGSHPTWTFRYWVWPLPTEGATLLAAWPACGLSQVEWPLQGALIDEGLRRSTALKNMQATADARGAPIKTELTALAGIAADLADLGASLQTPHPEATREPIISIPLEHGSVEIHQVTDDYLPNLERVLKADVVHLVSAHGAVNAQAIVTGTDAAAVARALATMLNSPQPTDLDQRSVASTRSWDGRPPPA